MAGGRRRRGGLEQEVLACLGAARRSLPVAELPPEFGVRQMFPPLAAEPVRRASAEFGASAA